MTRVKLATEGSEVNVLPNMRVQPMNGLGIKNNLQCRNVREKLKS